MMITLRQFPLSFNLAIVLPRRSVYALASGKGLYFFYNRSRMPNTHRSGYGLQGYRILFDPHTLASHRRLDW